MTQERGKRSTQKKTMQTPSPTTTPIPPQPPIANTALAEEEEEDAATEVPPAPSPFIISNDEFELVSAEEIEQGKFLDPLFDKLLEVCIKPQLGVWRRGRLTSYDTKRSIYHFLVDGESIPREFPFHASVFQILESSPELDLEDWVDLGGNYMIESVMFSERGDKNFHLFC